MLLASACAPQPQSPVSAVQNRPEPTRVETAPQTKGTNINTAGIDELEKLPGVGKSTAERIVAHREQYGPFRRAEHLLMVRGISDNKFRQLRTMIVVEF